MSTNTMTFAARDFLAGRGASDAHIQSGSVRSEQRSLAEKELMTTKDAMYLPNAQRLGTPRCGVLRPRATGGTDCSARRLGRVIDWTAGCAKLGSPSPYPSPLGRGRMVHRLSITPMTEFGQPPLATHETAGCCSLPPSRRSGALARREGGRERVRVRGNNSVARPDCSSL